MSEGVIESQYSFQCSNNNAYAQSSGSLKASKDDILMTNKMEKICEQIGIPLRDHIIVALGRVDYFSFRKENMIGSNLIQTIADGKEKAR